jgi:NHLM bacteriocin system ABC transporter ATP-binding protein
MTHPAPDRPTATTTRLALRIVGSDGAPAAQAVEIDGTATIGRDESCTIVLQDRSVSRRHASASIAGASLRVEDLGSGNGVWVDGQRVAHATLAPGDQFRIGSTVFACVALGAAADAPVTDDGEAGAEATQYIPAPVPVAAPAPGEIHVRVIEPGEHVSRGALFHVAGGTAVVGRGHDCEIVLPEKDVSRQHARIEVTSAGFRVTDLGSTCGVWVGPRQVKTTVVAAGQPFRVGRRIVLECAPRPFDATATVPPGLPASLASVADAPAAVLAEAAALQPGGAPAIAVAAMTGVGAVGAVPAVVDADGAGVAPSSLLTSLPGEPAPATPAARVAAPPTPPVFDDGTRVFRASEVIAPAAPVPDDGTRVLRPGDVIVPPAQDADFSGTVVIPVQLRAVEDARRIEEEGERLELNAHKPFLLEDPDAVYFVVSGGLLIFTVALEKGQPTGERRHFLGIQAGQACFGFDAAATYASGFFVVPKQDTVVRKMSLARLQALAPRPDQAGAVAGIIDAWVAGLSKALVRDLTTKRRNETALAADATLELAKGQKSTTVEDVLWIDIWSGSVLLDDMAVPVFPRKRTLFPVTPHSWVQLASDEFGTLTVTPRRTTDVLADDRLWHGLSVLHDVICECEFINKKLAAADEYVRLQEKARHSEKAEAAAYDAIGSVMQSESVSPREFLASPGTAPVLRACTLVGEAGGILVKAHPLANEDMTYEEQVAAVASASSVRTRVVALRDDWYRRDHGALLGQDASTKMPRALLPDGPRAYQMVDPATGSRVRVDAAVAATLTPFAYTFYRPMPDGMPTVIELLKFGGRGVGPDLKLTMGLAIVIGMFGTVTPYLTGQLFDVAIPQADQQALVVFGLALLGTAVATSIFKFVQGVATVRLQARMEGTIQAAVWDRLLNLPTTFFRLYPAGDLSDRASGVDQIQQLIAGAGIAAILGSVSGLFFVGQMFSFNMMLALLAVFLTIVFVAANMLANYLQLRYQRLEMRLRGRIAGLVLNLISGVSKLRISGAESHAFRVWASAFAEQKKLGFAVGNIQNTMAVFSAVFPVLSAMAIFQALIVLQGGGEATLTTGEFIAFNAAYGMFLGAMQSLGDASMNLLRAVPIYERIKPIFETQAEVDSSKAFPGQLKGGIELSHVKFRYSPDGPLIVNDISLKIKPGEFVAFVGSSGCGKSTLMRLMLGFEKPSSGSIYFDGQDLASLDVRMVRQQMGVVLQVSRVMPTEMYRNIIGVTSRTMEDAWAAAEKAGLADDIRNMPMGMHTYVSEGGGTLSGGQRQRLMIARAIVNRPKVLFLDEATSALDNRSQAIVTESMDKMDATRIVIAHRLSTIVNADRICYLDAGRIVEMGTYQELMEKDGLFAQLAKRQVA